jgi:hypothetical protein
MPPVKGASWFEPPTWRRLHSICEAKILFKLAEDGQKAGKSCEDYCKMSRDNEWGWLKMFSSEMSPHWL